MNARLAAILVVLLVVVGGGALLYQYQEASQRPANSDTLGRPLLKDLKAAEVASIRIVEPKGTLTVRQKDDRWVLPERGDFPADVAKVRDFVVQALSLKVGQSEPIGDKDRARLNLGRKYLRREADTPDKARADGRFVALPGEPKMVYVVSDPLAQATTKSSDWIDRTSFKVEKVKTLEVRYPEGGGYRIERDGDNADWRLAGARPDEKLEVTKANAASYSLGLLELADVAPPGTTLEQPVSIQASSFDGLTYAIRVGKLQGDNYPVSFSSSGTLQKNDKDAERIKKIEERLPREKLLSNYVLLVPKSKLEDTLKKRAEMLEKKDDAKKK